MPNANYQRGYRLEYRTMKLLEKKGWKVLRSPSSKGESDLIAFNKNAKLLVQCKTTVKDALYVYGLSPLLKLAEEHDAVPVIAYSFVRTPVYGAVVAGDKFSAKKKEENEKLENLIDKITKGGG